MSGLTPIYLLSKHFSLSNESAKGGWKVGAHATGLMWILTLGIASLAWHSTPAQDKVDPVAESQELADHFVREALLARLDADESRCRVRLDEALRVFPQHAQARWLKGYVLEQGEWVAVEDYQRRLSESSILENYETRRAEVMRSPNRELGLARWCARMRLFPQRDFHYGRLLASGRLTPRQVKDATSKLKHRPLEDFIPYLLNSLKSPMSSQFTISVTATGTVDYRLVHDITQVMFRQPSRAVLPGLIAAD